nr:retrotransposon protein, putative, Ty1-copia subclass [Tanacetum cinerariifolium]
MTKITVLDATDKCVSVDFVLLKKVLGGRGALSESIDKFNSNICDLENSLVREWQKDLRDKVEHLQARLKFKRNILGSLNQICYNLFPSFNHIIDEFEPCQVWRCQNYPLDDERRNKLVKSTSCPVTVNELAALDLIRNSLKAGKISLYAVSSAIKEKLVLDLKVGVKVDDEDQALILLCFLPGSYENLWILYCMDESSNSGSVDVVQDSSDDEDFGDVLTECNGIVKLGDNAVLIIKGSRIVRIKMHDGIVRKFDCWFVPGLKKILISFGTLAKNGLKYHVRDSSVIRTAVVSDSLYKHDDRTFYGTTKDEVFGKFKAWKTMVEKRIGKQVKSLRTANGLEFCNAPFDNFYKKEGIVRNRVVRHTPHQNRVAKRMNQTLMAFARSLLTAIGLKTPKEVWSGKPSNYSDLIIFSCPAYAHMNDGKHESRAMKCIFLGYATGVRGYQLLCTEGKSPDKFLISRYVTIDEYDMLGQSRGCESSAVKEEANNTDTGVKDSIAVRKGKRNDPKPARLLKKTRPRDLVTLPDGVKPVGCKWVFKRKEGIHDVEPAKFKARLVAKGFSQKEGIGYHEVFYLMDKHRTIRVLLAMVGAFDLELEQLDVKTAFLHDPRDVKIASLKQRILELEFPQLQQNSPKKEAETESNDIRDEEEEYPFVNKYLNFQEEPIMSVEEESCPVYDTDNKEEESMPVYDTDIEEVIEEENGDEKEVVYDQYEEEVMSKDFGRGFGKEEDTSEDKEHREHHTDDKDCDETHTRQLLDHSVAELFHQDLHG